MLDFLTRKKKERSEAEDTAGILFDGKAPAREQVKHDPVESFILNNNFHGTSLAQYSLKCLSRIAKEKEISQAAFFIREEKDGRPVVRFIAGFATPEPEESHSILELGEGFPGQVAKDGKLMNLSEIPEGYLVIESGLGKAAPVSLILFPVKNGDDVLAVIELSSFHKFTGDDEQFFKSISPSIAEQILKCTNKAS
ncbi:MAG TPA: GAF domain-containing protein [Bacteroidales bacterium]|nr:GAF domain-containing protein [Bacteroidales bacterium]